MLHFISRADIVQNIRSISDLYTRKSLLQDPLGVLIKSFNKKSRYEFKVAYMQYYLRISEYDLQ